MKRLLSYITGWSLLLVGFTQCSFFKGTEPVKMTGFIQGTTYTVIWYADQSVTTIQQGIDSLFSLVNQTASLYDSSSVISRFNRNEPCDQNRHFRELVAESQKISEETNGAFDITVEPLIRLYGFYRKEGKRVPDSLIQAVTSRVGYKKIEIAPDGLIMKQDTGIEIDLNGIAQGYTVDLVAHYLESMGIDRYLVEIGGEVRCGNRKPNEDLWVIGIEKPAPSDTAPQSVQERIAVENRSVATSGNYRNYFREDGHTFSHTLDPRTGYPMKDGVISVTVIALNCTDADAFATALMVMGPETGQQFVEAYPELEAYFIFSKNGEIRAHRSSGFPDFLETE